MNVVDSTGSPFARLRPVPTEAVTLTDAFWEPRREINRRVTLPTQFRHIEDTSRLDNFRRASGKKTGIDFVGIYFNDSDVYKWLEGAVVEGREDPALQPMIETAIVEIQDAQQADGYLNTYFMFEREKDRWTNLRDMHEMYCAGHFIQSAVAHYRSGGDDRLLNVARRLADHMDAKYGPEGEPGACGHEEAELALVELYRATGETRYLALAKRMIDARGQEPSAVLQGRGGDRRYHQDHVPYRQLSEVTGHAVRMMYLAAGAADVYLETGEQALWDAMMRQWDNMTERRSYVSGGLGARYEGEAFGKDYELPNDRAYSETCAAIGSVMWNWRLLLATGDARYSDLIEHTLFNAVLPGLSLDGQHYFYQNPLENDGAHRRQPWFGCACCPPNVARLLAQLTGYFYSVDDAGDIFVHLYARGSAQIALPDGRTIPMTVTTEYPFDGEVEITVGADGDFGVCLRVPEWAGGARLSVNGEDADATPGTYARLRRDWKTGDVIRLELPFEPRFLRSHPYVSENTARVAVFVGPLLYCAEKTDNGEIPNLQDAYVADPADFEKTTVWDLPGVVALRGSTLIQSPVTMRLYGSRFFEPSHAMRPLTLVPYYAWANRDPGQMIVWLREQE
ncbi:MAG: glycoside hydrolase family 127 protein [Capsulimonadales bacterium]|nr:glycoside hydrolase family 127 protein [Capsulimonadales bacterium]